MRCALYCVSLVFSCLHRTQFRQTAARTKTWRDNLSCISVLSFFFQSLVSFTLESSIYIDDTHTIVLDIVSRLLTEVRIFPFVWHFFD